MTFYEEIMASMGAPAPATPATPAATPPAAVPVPPAETPPAVTPLPNAETGHFSKEFEEAFPKKEGNK